MDTYDTRSIKVFHNGVYMAGPGSRRAAKKLSTLHEMIKCISVINRLLKIWTV